MRETLYKIVVAILSLVIGYYTITSEGSFAGSWAFVVLTPAIMFGLAELVWTKLLAYHTRYQVWVPVGGIVAALVGGVLAVLF